ncbi:MAG TPA: adenylosuccinate lyase [Nitrososphaerales archaeon]|nr:adenylosuccinate lyase [Nitrososphaerales archaeon]
MKEDAFGYGDFLSPFTWRYGSKEMRELFSERRRRATWRQVWLALASAEMERGILSKEELADIRAHAGGDHVDIGKSHDLERSIRHDLMAELRVFAGQAKKGGGKLHLGATSMDIEDNADVILHRRAVDMLLSKMTGCLAALKERIVKHRRTVCMAWTHLQPAEPTTLGYRFASYAQDLVLDVELLESVRATFLRGKGVKGAVGTSASFQELLGRRGRPSELESEVMRHLGIESFEVTTQTYPRKSDFVLLSALASVAQSCHKFGLDLRVMQSPPFGELSEPIGEKQVGSSAMPFKRNPVTAERMCSLARFVSVLPGVAFLNAANSVLERTLDDSAARRIAIPEAFLATDECLTIYERLVTGLQVYPAMIRRNLERYGPFAGTEPIMMKLAERGADRQKTHERIRKKSFAAWKEVMEGRPNPLEKLLWADRSVSARMTRTEMRELLDATRYVGDAPERCDSFMKGKVDPILSRHQVRSDSGGPEY